MKKLGYFTLWLYCFEDKGRANKCVCVLLSSLIKDIVIAIVFFQ